MKRPEQDLQMAVCDYLDVALPKGWRYWATYNNAKNKTQGGINKAMGVKAGVPDLFVAGPLKGEFLLVGIELKVDNGRLSPAQKDWCDWLIDSGADFCVCRDVLEVEGSLLLADVPLRASAGGEA